MPDWITHITFNTYIFLPVRKRQSDFGLFLLGAILPDLTKIFWVQALDFANLKFKIKEFLIWYFEPFHTPFMAIFVSLVFAILISGSIKRNFIIIYSGSIIHFLLDALQKHFSFYQLLFYPFSFKNYNFQLFHTSEKIWFFISISFLPFFIFIIIKNWDSEIRLVLRQKILLIFLIIFIILFPFFTKEGFYRANFNSILFLKNPSKFEGKKVELGVSYIKKVEKEKITVVEIGKEFQIFTGSNYNFKTGEFVSVRGIYKNGTIYPEILLKEPLKRKKYFSLLVFIFVFIFILKSIISQLFSKRFGLIKK